MPTSGRLIPLEILAGVQPETDATGASTPHYTYSDKIRFSGGVPEKIGGWAKLTFDYSDEIRGIVRSYFSAMISGITYGIIGSHSNVYSVLGARLVNVTPLSTSATNAANSLTTQYDTLAANPIATVNGSPTITITDSDYARFVAGDVVTISGAATTNGIADTAINGEKIIRSIVTGGYTINTGANATSTGSGGGASVVRASGLIEVTNNVHAQTNGDRTKIIDAATTGGVTNTEINKEFLIRNVSTNTFDIMTEGTATSAVTAGGGAATKYYKQISAGNIDEGNASGYGAGLYGIGLYGTPKESSSLRAYPRIWFFDRYGNTIIANAGNQSGIYQWTGDTNIAPALITNAPTKVNYAFVSNNILVTFGAEDSGNEVENRVFASDYADIINWTSSSTNQVFDDDIEGAGKLISHAPIEGRNLIFTEHQTYSLRYIGLPYVWEIEQIDNAIGIIAPMARCSVKGIAFWMGLNNFYMYRGGSVEIIPSNSGNESTVLSYVFSNLNWGQKSKCFAWYNPKYNEVWFHYPSLMSLECDRVIVVNLLDFTWVPHILSRSAVEYPVINSRNPKLANQSTLYKHEFGNDNDTYPLEFELTSNKRFYGKQNVNLTAIIPDSIQDGSITFTATGMLFPQSTMNTYSNSVTVTPTTERVPFVSSARFYQYSWSGSVLDQSWSMGTWYEEQQAGAME